MAVSPPPALAGPLPIVTPRSGNDPMPINQIARTIQVALDNVNAPRQMNELSDKVASVKTTNDLQTTFRDLVGKINDWKDTEGKERGTTDPLYITMSRIERLLSQQLVLSKTDTAIASKMLAMEEVQKTSTQKMKEATEKQLSIWQEFEKRVKEDWEDRHKEFKDRNGKTVGYDYSDLDDGRSHGRGGFRNAMGAISQHTQNYTGLHAGLLTAAAKGLVGAGAVAAGILSMAGEIINGWLGAERAGVGKATALLGTAMGSSSIPAMLFKGFAGLKIGSVAGGAVGTLIGSLMGPAGGILGGLAGRMLGGALGVTAAVWMTAMGPEKMTQIIHNMKNTVMKAIDYIFGTSLVIDQKVIDEERAAILKGLESVTKHKANNIETVTRLQKQKQDILDQLNQGITDPGKISELMKELDKINGELGSENSRTSILGDQEKDLLGRYRTQLENQKLEDERLRNRYLKDLGKTSPDQLPEGARKSFDAILAEQKKRIDEMETMLLEEAKKRGDEAYQQELYELGKPRRRTQRRGIYLQRGIEQERNRLQEPIPTPVPEIKSPSPLKAPEAPQSQIQLPQFEQMAMNSNNRISDVTERLVRVASKFEDLKDNVSKSRSGSAPVMINAPSPTNNVAVSNAPVNIYGKTDPRGITDPMIRRSAFGYV